MLPLTYNLQGVAGNMVQLSVSATRPADASCMVFISYRVSEADAEARLLKAKYEALGISAFVSSMDIPSGANWRRVIGRNLDSCR